MASLGIIVPSVNTVLEPELMEMTPVGVTLHFARARYVYRGVADTADPLIRMARDAEAAARQLGDAGVDVIGYGSTGGSFYAGPRYHELLTRQITEWVGLPATTASTAVIEALRAIGARTVVVATPYVELDNERERTLLTEYGFEVPVIMGMGIHDGGAIRNVSLESVRAFVGKVFTLPADAYFISCTNLRSAALISELEVKLRRPVITSNQALLWHMLRLAGIKTGSAGFGRLLRDYL